MLFDWFVVVQIVAIALMTFSFARVGAAVGMRVEDYFSRRQALAAAPQRKRRQGP